MSRDQDEFGAPPELPSLEKGPRAPDQQAWTGTGTPRSAGDRFQESGAVGDGAIVADVDPAIAVGGTTSSHPSAADEVDINRSGSGGTGGPTTDDAGLGASSESMEEMLGGEPSEGSRS
jgi:hypothetical protein